MSKKNKTTSSSGTSYNDVRFLQTLDLGVTQNRLNADDDDDDSSVSAQLKSRRTHYGLLNNLTKTAYGDKSTIRCRTCAHRFDTPRCGLPVFHDKNRSVFYLEGNFCNWPCVMHYNSHTVKNQHGRHEREQWIHIIAQQEPWSYENRVTCAPDPTMLKCMGGYLSLKTYRQLGLNGVTIRTTWPSDRMTYTFVGRPPAFEVQDFDLKRDTDVRHKVYRELFDKHLPLPVQNDDEGDASLNASTDVTMTDVRAPKRRKKQTNPAVVRPLQTTTMVHKSSKRTPQQRTTNLLQFFSNAS